MKINKIAGSLAFIASLVTASGAAQANMTYEMGVITGFKNQIATNPSNTYGFTDTFNFNITSTSNVTASLDDLEHTHVTPYFSLVIYKDQNLFLSLNGNTPIGNTQSATSFNLDAGNYSAVVTGDAVGLQGGLYSVTISAQPVPVPAAAWLLASGLIGLVAVARRKEQA